MATDNPTPPLAELEAPTRRAFLLALPPAAVAGLIAASPAAASPTLAELLEAVMETAVPGRFGTVMVDTDALEDLCIAADVEFAEHWAMRGKRSADGEAA